MIIHSFILFSILFLFFYFCLQLHLILWNVHETSQVLLSLIISLLKFLKLNKQIKIMEHCMLQRYQEAGLILTLFCFCESVLLILSSVILYQVLLNIHNNEMVIGIALTEESLHRRNITHFGPTTLRSTLAYGMLRSD